MGGFRYSREDGLRGAYRLSISGDDYGILYGVEGVLKAHGRGVV